MSPTDDAPPPGDSRQACPECLAVLADPTPSAWARHRATKAHLLLAGQTPLPWASEVVGVPLRCEPSSPAARTDGEPPPR